MEKTTATTIKLLFGEPKEKPIITNVDRNEVSKKL